jgi:iron complex outermembrane receptor protein
MLSIRTQLFATSVLAGAALFTPASALAQSVAPVPATQSEEDRSQSANPADAPPAGPIEAQPPATAGPTVNGNEIVVTGSRIPQPNLTSAAPVATVSSQEIKLQGATRIEDVLSQLPSASAPQGASLPNPSTGTAEIDLRYLGAQRTLTLVNGRRMAPGDPNQGSTGAGDVNLIPAPLVKRVEVLTGGASSVYGADAVAGVVNFIMDTDFEGLRLDGQWSIYQHNNNCPGISGGQTACDALNDRINAGVPGFDYPKGSVTDGRNIDASASFGAGFDDGRGHVVGYFGYMKQDAVLQAARDYSACNLSGSSTPTCGGSSFSAEGNFLVTTPGNGSAFYHRGDNGELVPDRTRYNYAPLNHWVKPDVRYTGGVFAHYDVNSAVRPYLEFMYLDDKQVAQIAPSGNFGNTFVINCDNPFMSESARAIVCATGNQVSSFLGTFPLTPNSGGPGTPINFVDQNGTSYNEAFFQVFRRNVEGGPRRANFEHSSYRGVIGTKGDLSDAFSYDAYYQAGRTNYSQVFDSEFSQVRLNRSVNVVLDPRADSPTFGQPVCRSVLDNSDPSCVPYDYFGTPSAAALNYVNVSGVITGQTNERIADVNLTGQLGKLGIATPWAPEGFGVNVGWEYRKESIELHPDQEFATGDLTGQGRSILPIDGNFHVNELFAEAQLPIVEHDFIDELSFGAGYRKSWYETGAGRKYDTDTYKLSVQFAPVRDIELRGSYNRAVRAPTIFELFTTPHIALDGSIDLCADHAITATEFGCIAQLQAAGIANPIGFTTPGNPSEQYNGLLGGNPDLLPEVATTKTAGIVLQPRFLPRFALTVDYWNIDLKGAIQGFGADTIMADCVANSTAAAAATSCGLIHRDPGGSLWLVAAGSPGAGYIVDTPTNSGRIKTDGWDINSAYSQRLGRFGSLSLSFLGTYLSHYKVNNSIAPTYDCAGFYGTVCSGAAVASSSAMPRWRHKLRATLATPLGLGVSVNWRHVGPVDFEHLSDDAALAGDLNQLNSRVKAQNYIDLSLTYSLLDAVNLRAGVNNLFDRIPPIIPTANGACPGASCAGNTYPGTWDYMGRYIYAGVTVDFKHHAPPPPPPFEAPPPPPAIRTTTCPGGLVIVAGQECPAEAPPPPPPPAPGPERGY